MNAQLMNEMAAKTGLYIPEDLRLMVEDRTLVYLALEALHTVSWLRPAAIQQQSEATPEPVLRTLVLYCYAAGIWGSRDIEFAATSDSTAKYICAGDVPEWAVIRQFRRQNAPQIKLALIELLRLVLGSATMRADISGIFQAGGNEESKTAELIRDAEFRLRQAIRADSMASDE